MESYVLSRITTRGRLAESREDEQKMAAVLDSCLDRISDGREVSFVLHRTPEATAYVRPLLEVATLLTLRGRLMRGLPA